MSYDADMNSLRATFHEYVNYKPCHIMIEAWISVSRSPVTGPADLWTECGWRRVENSEETNGVGTNLAGTIGDEFEVHGNDGDERMG
jgi:hypothetical protein